MGLLEVIPNLRRLARRHGPGGGRHRWPAARRCWSPSTRPASPCGWPRASARRGIPVVHYVAPQVWAWRPGRVKRSPRGSTASWRCCPSSRPSSRRPASRSTFVGHPVLESGADAGDAARFRAAHGLRAGGARRDGHAGQPAGPRCAACCRIFGEALRRWRRPLPGLRPVSPLAGAGGGRGAGRRRADWPVPPILVPRRRRTSTTPSPPRRRCGLIKSGTSSLEVALAGVPHVVGYRVNPITAAIVRRLIKVPLSSPWSTCWPSARWCRNCCSRTAPRRGWRRRCWRWLRDPAAVAAQRAGFAEVLARLRAPEGLPSEAAAVAVLDVLDGRSIPHNPAQDD